MDARSSPSTFVSKKKGGSPEVSGRFPLLPLLERDHLLDVLFREIRYSETVSTVSPASAVVDLD
jgi:hypothetical protein